LLIVGVPPRFVQDGFDVSFRLAPSCSNAQVSQSLNECDQRAAEVRGSVARPYPVDPVTTEWHWRSPQLKRREKKPDRSAIRPVGTFSRAVRAAPSDNPLSQVIESLTTRCHSTGFRRFAAELRQLGGLLDLVRVVVGTLADRRAVGTVAEVIREWFVLPEVEQVGPDVARFALSEQTVGALVESPIRRLLHAKWGLCLFRTDEFERSTEHEFRDGGRDGRAHDDDELLALLMEANPALQSGRIDPKLLLDDVRALPTDDIVRYRLNRFIQSGRKTFIPAELWQKCERSFDEVMPRGDVVFAIDRTPDWEHATIAAAVKVDDVIYTELVASINKPTLEQLLYICGQLMSHSPRSIIVDGYTLRDLYKELKTRGYPAETATLGDIVNASSMFYSRLARRTLQHAGDPLLSIQVPRTVRKMIGEGFRVSRRDSAVEIDAVMATLLATFGAETLREQTLQVF